MGGFPTSFDEFLNGNPTVLPPKQAQVAATAAQKKTAVAAKAEGYSRAAQRDVGITPRQKTVSEIIAAADDPNQLVNLQGQSQYMDDRVSQRGNFEAVNDAVVRVADGAVSGVGTPLEWAAGAIDADAGAFANRMMKGWNDYSQDNLSEAALRHDQALNARLTEAEKRNESMRIAEGDTLSGLRKAGRDIVDAIEQSAADPVTFSSGIEQAAGSILSAGVLSKGLRIAGRPVAQALGKAGIASGVVSADSVAAGKAYELARAGVTPVVIGAQEGGGAYDAVMRQLLDEGVDPEKADHAAQTAAMIQAPLGVVTGSLVSKFEGNPLGKFSYREIMGNMMREAVEEGIQGGSGQFAQNVGVHEVHPDQDLHDDIGQQIGIGALYGLGAAGAVQGPGAVARAPIEAAKLALKGIGLAGSGAANLIQGRLQAVRDGNAKTAKFSEKTVRDATNDVAANADSVRATVDQADLSDEQKLSAQDHLDNLFKAAQIDPVNYTDAPAIVQDAVAGASDKLDAIQRLAGVVVTDESTPQDVTDAGNALFALLKENEQLIAASPDDHPALPELRKIEDVLASYALQPKVLDALQKAQEQFVSNAKEGKLTVDDIDQVLHVARTAPEVIDPELIDKILGQKPETRRSLTQEDIQRTSQPALTPRGPARTKEEAQAKIQELKFRGLWKANGLNNATEDQVNQDNPLGFVGVDNIYDAAMKRGGLSDSAALTGRELNPSEILTLKGISNVAKASTAGKLRANELGLEGIDDVSNQILKDDDTKSVMAHMRGIVGAMEDGDTEAATDRLTSFRDFAQHMQNKVDGLNRDLADKGNTKFQARNYNNGKFFESKSYITHLHNRVSVQGAQQIGVEAGVVADAANSLIDMFPELEVTKVEKVDLDPVLQQHADDVIKQFAKPEPKAPAEPKPTPEAAETAQPEGGDASTEAEVVDRESETTTVDDREEPSDDTQDRGDQSAEIDDTPSEASEPDAPQREEPTEEVAPSEDASPDGSGEADRSANPLANLIGRKIQGIVDLFAKGFKKPISERTRFREGVSPLALIRDVFGSPTRLANFMGGKTKNKFTAQISAEYSGYLSLADHIMAKVQANLDSFLDSPKMAYGPKGSKKLFRELVLEGHPNATVLPRTKALNIIDLTDDGKLVYNQELLEKATLAALQWALNASDRVPPVDKEAAAAITGLDEEQAGQYIEHLVGLSPTDAANTLASQILRFWGLQLNDSEALGHGQGILEGVAKELLTAMTEVNLFDSPMITRIDLADNPDLPEFPNTVTRWVPAKFKTKQGEPHPIMGYPTALEDAIAIDPEVPNFIGEPPVKASKTQLRSDIPLAGVQEKAQQAAQNTPHRVNTRMVSFYQALGLKGAIGLFGEPDLDKRSLNKNHRATLEGRNLTISGAFDKLMNTLAEVANVGDLKSTPIYYRYEYTRVNRLQMQGSHNPQASKFTREAILPTWDTLDLVNNAEHQGFFHLALAQALGVKIHQMDPETSIQKVLKLLDEMPETVKILSDPSKITEADIATIRDQLGGGKPVTNVAVHAVMEYARYQAASAAEKAAFETALYIEADGVTNGVVNAMIMMTSGVFTEEWVENAKKGGMFYDGTPSMNAHRQTASGENDLYQTTGNILQRFLTARVNSLDPNSVDAKQLTSLVTLMSRLGLKIDINDKGELVIDRGVTKNPLTITMYGSGARGIAGNVTQTILDAVYEMYSKVLENQDKNPELSTALAAFGDQVDGNETAAEEIFDEVDQALKSLLHGYLNDKGKVVYADDLRRDKAGKIKPAFRGKEGLKDFSYDKIDFRVLQENVLRQFVNPMRKSIEETLAGDTLANANLLRMATQLQSIKLHEDYIKAVSELVAKKKATDPTFKMSDFVSKNDLKAIIRELLKTNPYLKGQDQNIFVSRSENLSYNDLGGKAEGYVHISNNLSETFKTPADIKAPSDAKVAGIPLTVISLGDGHMIQLVLSMDGAPEGTLPVFDGVHMKLSTVSTDSPKINQAAYQSWFNSPIKLALEAFEVFSANHNPEDIDLLSLARVVYGPQINIDDNTGILYSGVNRTPDNEIDPSDVYSAIEAILPDLRRADREIDARQQVMREYAMTVDQMASVGEAYTSEGISLAGKTSAQIAEIFNQRYFEILQGDAETITQPEAKPEVAGEEVEASTDETPAELESNSTLQKFGRTKSNLKVYSNRALRMLLANGNMSVEQKSVLKEILKSFIASDYKILVGTPEEVARFLVPESEVAGMIAMWGHDARGFTDTAEKYVAVFPTGGPETMVHELIHAATYEKVKAFYRGEIKDPETRAAIERLEALMQQFQGLDLPGRLYGQVRHIIQDYLIDRNPAAALNEFMAYVLANRTLAEVAQNTKAEPKGLVSTVQGLFRNALDSIKKLIFGRKHMPKAGEDMFSNLLFNTSIVLRNSEKIRVSNVLNAGGLFHNPQYGDSDRLAEISRVIRDKVGRHLSEIAEGDITARLSEKHGKRKEFVRAYRQSLEVSELFRLKGFDMSMQEQSTFSNLVGIMATAIQLDANVLTRVQDFYTHVEKLLKVENFMTEAEQASNDPNARKRAERKYNTIMGVYGVKEDGHGRTSLMPSFIALAMTNDEFRAVLAKMELPKWDKNPGTTIDAKLENYGSQVMEKLAKLFSGEKGTDVLMAMDSLIGTMLETAKDRESFVETYTRPAGTLIDRGNQWTVDALKTLSDKGMSLGERLKTNAAPDSMKHLLGELTELTSSFLSEENSKVGEAAVAGVNNIDIWQPIRSLIADIVGRTASNAQVYDLIKKVKAAVSQVRQQFREHLPKTLASHFSRTLTDAEWSHLYHGLAKTDLAALKAAGMNKAEILQLLSDDAALQQKIRQVELRVKAEDRANWTLIQNKSLQLARRMSQGARETNLLRNAYAIAGLMNEPATANRTPSDALIQGIDELVTLYALNLVNADSKAVVSSLAQAEGDGVHFALSYLESLRKDDLAKVQDNIAKFNHFKGYVPNEKENTGTLIVADDRREQELRLMSFTRLGNYDGSDVETSPRHRSYYYLPVEAQPGFQQGIIQNVRPSAGGVDLTTGYTYGGLTAGRIVDHTEVRRITRRLSQERSADVLEPIFDVDGSVVAYERSIDPVEVERLQGSTHLGKMMGVWQGRQVEEQFAQQTNIQLIDALKVMYDKDAAQGKGGQYVDLFRPQTDRIIADAVNLWPKPVRDYAHEVFGRRFMVRKEMLEQVTGYRGASVGDMWTGNSRWSPAAQEKVKALAISVFGNDAYRKLVAAEKLTQNLVIDAKLTIVAKSVIVPMANFVANIFQLMARGVPIAHIASRLPRKLAEVDAYVRTRQRLMDAQAELKAVENDLVASRRLKTEIKTIEDNHRNLSIWPLIERGELSSISDIGISQEELLLSSGRLNQYMEGLVSRVPESVKTLARYGWISRDTALFKGLQRSIEYGDFLAKAVQYDDLIGRQKKSKEQALAFISEEFVNYDYLPGRFRGTLENLGLMWFWSFKIRSAKVAVSIMRNNPLHALLSHMVPHPDIGGEVGSPMEDNIFSVIFNGNAPYSIGPGQGIRSPFLHPVGQLLS